MYGITNTRRARLMAGVVGGAGSLALVLSGCSSTESPTNTGSTPDLTADTGLPITVWVDADRQAAADAYTAAYPNDPVTVEIYDGGANGSGTFRTKMQLFDTAGSGWPDVVFSTQNNDAAWASQAQAGGQPYAAVLNEGLVPDSVISGFATGSLDPCTVDGKIYCLRNDLAQTVLWYDKVLLDEFGYALPTTWEEYSALGVKVAAEHPGYIIGTQGDPWTPEIYFWSSKCEANHITGASSVTVNTASPECTRAAEMLDTLRANGTNPNISVFTPEFLTQYAGKVLMIPGPAWYGGALFQNPSNLNVPAGEIAVAGPLPWAGEEAVAGDVGGATWFISSHSENPGLAAKFAEFVTTADAYQVDLAPGFPAFSAAEAKWLTKQDGSGYYAGSISPLVDAGGMIWSGWGSGIFSQEAIWAKVMTPAITEGKNLVDMLPNWAQAIKDQAQVDGYTVN